MTDQNKKILIAVIGMVGTAVALIAVGASIYSTAFISGKNVGEANGYYKGYHDAIERLDTFTITQSTNV